MFCQKCGKENTDGAAFCSSCGVSLTDVTSLETKDLLSQLYIAEETVNTVWPYKKQVVDTENQVKEHQDRLSKLKKECKVVWIILAVCAGIALVFFLVGLILSWKFEPYENFWGHYYDTFWESPKSDGYKTALWMFGLLVGFPAAILLIGVIVCKIIVIVTSKKLVQMEKQLKKHKRRHDKLFLDEALAARMKTAEELLPKECMDPKYARVYISALETGRAVDAKEALQVFDLYMYREQMLKISEETKKAVVAAKHAAEAAAMEASRAAAAANRPRGY